MRINIQHHDQFIPSSTSTSTVPSPFAFHVQHSDVKVNPVSISEPPIRCLKDPGRCAVGHILRLRQLDIELCHSSARSIVARSIISVLGLHGRIVVARGIPIDEASRADRGVQIGACKDGAHL